MKYGCGTENKKEEMIAINTITQKPTYVRKPRQSSQEFLSVQSTSYGILQLNMLMCFIGYYSHSPVTQSLNDLFTPVL